MPVVELAVVAQMWMVLYCRMCADVVPDAVVPVVVEAAVVLADV